MIELLSGMSAFITVERFCECLYTVSTGIYNWWYPLKQKHIEDIKQIEVFKGPHTTTFGPNAMAGAINIISEQPGNNTEIIVCSDVADFKTNNYSLIIIIYNLLGSV